RIGLLRIIWRALWRTWSRQRDLNEIYDHCERKDGRGLAAYYPETLTRVLLYGYAIGESSSRRIEQATYDDVAFRYLAADQHPDHDTIASFRQQHLESLGGTGEVGACGH